MNSIRRHLLLALLCAVLLGSLAGAWATWRGVREELDEIFDYNLRQLALSMRDMAYGVATALPLPDPEFDFVIQVWNAAGARLYYAHRHADPPGPAGPGFSTTNTSEGRWRVFAIVADGLFVQVAHPLAVRERLAAEAALRTLLPYLLLLPLLAIVVGWLVGRGLAPLRRVTRAVAARRADSLEPVALADVPDEIQPLVEALNGLLARLATALQAQRDFTADAAHELRSPLTALSLQVQLLERAHDAAGRTAALAELRGGIARAVHLVDQLLKLARLGPEVGSATEPVRLAELAARVLAEHAPLATAKAIDLGLGEVDPALSVRGDPAGLRLLLSNLVGNAVRYTPDGGRVDVSVLAEGPQALLVVSDTGPGIPADERGRVFDRFYRRPGETAEGSGLGLAIVRAVADRHGADVRLGDADGGGLRVEVRFPPAAA